MGLESKSMASKLHPFGDLDPTQSEMGQLFLNRENMKHLLNFIRKMGLTNSMFISKDLISIIHIFNLNLIMFQSMIHLPRHITRTHGN